MYSVIFVWLLYVATINHITGSYRWVHNCLSITSGSQQNAVAVMSQYLFSLHITKQVM